MTIDCTFPPELDDRQLLAFLDGEAAQETVSHLKACVYCRRRAEKLDRFQKRLTARLYRHTCPSVVELGEYHLHLLAASEMLVIGQHLRKCPHCAHEVAQLESFLDDQRLHPEDSLLGRAKLLIARLMDPEELAFKPAATALRGESRGPITVAVEDIVIVLDLQPAAGSVTILGQIAASAQNDWTGALVELRRDNNLQVSGTVDELGAFRCDKVTPGSQELRITSRNGAIVVMANFEVPA